MTYTTHIIQTIDDAIKARPQPPTGMIVGLAVFHILHESGRLSRGRFTPDWGIDFWKLDSEIYVTPDPFIQGDFILSVA